MTISKEIQRIELNMNYEEPLNTLLEITVRVGLWCLFIWLDKQEPFILRHIDEEEVWMYRYPSLPSTVPSNILWVMIITFPTIVFLVESLKTWNREEVQKRLINMTLALTLAHSINSSMTCLLKAAVGRPRPNFFYRCFPDGYGTNFFQCTGEYREYMDGRKSFPSGHSSNAFTCMVFMSIHLFKKFDIVNTTFAKGCKFCICIAPIIIATLIAITRVTDYHHHYSDVIGGAILGTVVASTTYWIYLSPQEV